MSIIRTIVILSLILTGAGSRMIVSAGDISANVFPSEEELLEAYRLGLIEWETYRNLSELNEYGIDSAELYLIEEIPNLHYIADTINHKYTDFEKRQLKPYLVPVKSPIARKTGYLRWRGYKKIEEFGESKSYIMFKSALGNDWTAKAAFREDYDGRERITRRSFIYRGKRGPVKRMVIGNFTARFGLGLTVGYRGRLLDKYDQATINTMAFPDYGGFNGLFVEGGRNTDGIRFLAHYDRNDNYSLKSAAINLIGKLNSWRVEFTGAGAFMDNLITGAEYKHYQISTFAKYTHPSFYAALEIAHARDADNLIPAALFETAYRNQTVRLELSAWRYSRDFKNITGGGRAGALYQSVDIDTIDFDYRDKRVNQKGFLYKTKATVNQFVSGNLAFTVYGRDRFENNIHLLISPEIAAGFGHTFGLDYRFDRKQRPDQLKNENEIRGEHRLNSSNLTMRSYIGYVDDDNGCEYISLFNRTKINLDKYGTWELWLNLDKFNIETRQNDYLYIYLREKFQLTYFLELAAKYSYRYSRAYRDRELSVFMLEMKALW